MRRRDLLATSALMLAGLPLIQRAQSAEPAARTAFDFAWLKGRARTLSATPYAAVTSTYPAALQQLDWDGYQAIRFRPERALWADTSLPFRIQFFHLGLHYREPVRMHEVADGNVHDVNYDASMFDYGRSGIDATRLPADLGFAGFRIHFHTDFAHDITVFLGASYFRAIGGAKQYGLSARGLAVDCGLTRPEEFPRFTEFWLVRPAPGATQLTVYALLDSPSIAGAYRFDIAPGDTQTMRVDAALYPREAIERLGIAPLTSMFLCAPHDRRVRDDWRPSIHDSDGLAMHTGTDEWIWRPLANPAAVRVNAFADSAPRGFGLLQRDRNFDHYQDDGAYYDRRPSLWVEPLSGFAKGAVDLLEIPTSDETADNIVAFWNAAEAAVPQQELLYAYKLYWGASPPVTSPLARAAISWSGIGGIVGQPHDYFSWRFVVDFSGGPLASLAADAKVEAVVTSSSGALELISARPLQPIRGYRAMFDVRPVNRRDSVDLRLFLRANGRALSETWSYQWTPPAQT